MGLPPFSLPGMGGSFCRRIRRNRPFHPSFFPSAEKRNKGKDQTPLLFFFTIIPLVFFPLSSARVFFPLFLPPVRQ